MLKNLKIPRLGINRRGVFFVRFPSTFDAEGRRRVVQQSLKTKDPDTAKVLALRFCLSLVMEGKQNMTSGDRHDIARYHVNVNTGEASADGPDDHERLMAFFAGHKDLILTLAKLRAETPQATPPVGLVQASASPNTALPDTGSAMSLDEAFELHLGVERRVVTTHTVSEKAAVYRDFMVVFGAATPVRAISAPLIATRWTPIESARPNTKFGGTLGLRSLDKRRLYLSKFFDWAADGELHGGPNPMAAKIATKSQIVDDGDAYSEFTSDDLTKIFSAEFVQHMDKPDWYWIPLMGLFSGARLGELCGLRVSDFKIVEGFKIFDIDEGKNAPSIRRVPIHSKLLDLGLWEFVEALRARGATYFLHHRSADYLQKSTGLRFAIWIKKLGIKDEDPMKVFHSFRSTAITDMHNTGGGGAAIRRAVGHSTAETKGVHGKYIRGIWLKNLSSAVEGLNFPSIDFEAIRLPDPTFKQFLDDSDAWLASEEYKLQQERRTRHEEARQKRLEGRPFSAK